MAEMLLAAAVSVLTCHIVCVCVYVCVCVCELGLKLPLNWKLLYVRALDSHSNRSSSKRSPG